MDNALTKFNLNAQALTADNKTNEKILNKILREVSAASCGGPKNYETFRKPRKTLKILRHNKRTPYLGENRRI